MASRSSWVDDSEDLPLRYSFYYAIAGAATEYQVGVWGYMFS
jgi:hypothetical protein